LLVDLAQGPGQGGRGGDLTEQVTLVTQHVDTAYGVPTVGHHHRGVGQDPAPVMTRGEPVPAQRPRQGRGQAGTVGCQPKRGSTGV